MLPAKQRAQSQGMVVGGGIWRSLGLVLLVAAGGVVLLVTPVRVVVVAIRRQN